MSLYILHSSFRKKRSSKTCPPFFWFSAANGVRFLDSQVPIPNWPRLKYCSRHEWPTHKRRPRRAFLRAIVAMLLNVHPMHRLKVGEMLKIPDPWESGSLIIIPNRSWSVQPQCTAHIRLRNVKHFWRDFWGSGLFQRKTKGLFRASEII